MHSWTMIIVLVVVFGFAVEFRPTDHFMTAYFTGPRINITTAQVTDELPHLEDYSSILAFLVIMIITDYYLLYKPVMLFNVFCGILVYGNLVMLPNFLRLKMAKLCVAFFKSYETVYFSYLFAKVHDKRFYQATSGLARTAMLLGKFCSSVFAQTLVFNYGKSYAKNLPCYTLGSVIFAFVWASFLPSVRQINSNDDVLGELVTQNNNGQPQSENKIVQCNTSCETILIRMWKDLNESYRNPIVLKWSVWYCLALVGYKTINMSFVTRGSEKNEQMNGVVECLTTLIGAVISYKIGVKRVNWKLKSNAFIGAGSLILGVCVTFCYFHQQILSIQLSYVLFGTIIQAMFVVSLSETARHLKNKCYALVLCFNSLLSLILLLCYKEFFIYSKIFHIDVSKQILLFGSLYIIVGTFYLIPCVIAFNRRLKNKCPVYQVTE
ncbi:Reduced folate carrier,Major facilitator superfamily domain [Cinara cedri]|uniref:Reduced folate carrier,Major facilitator superfamily domain n=1 Tax=Cinara cedri TaxID=506608 RepID=A0A5E4M2A6_9HEMI|nr:Reduced folate carrier,Major facilitator superfamily domain [Cinara cedri]